MAEEKQDKKEQPENTDSKPSFKTAEELTTFLHDLQGQMANMQETVDKLSPVEEHAEDKKEGKEETKEEPSEKEISEIDSLLQSE